MRIIAGTAKGTRLSSLGKSELRPTLDRVRESLFNILSPRIEEARWLDLFAGTGAVSLEAMSRGAACAVMVEPDQTACSIIEKNRSRCKMEEGDILLLRNDALRALQQLESRNEAFDIVYVDPPFAEGFYEPILKVLGEKMLLMPDAWVIVEHFHKQEIADNYGKLTQFDQRRIGDTTLTFFS